MDQIHLHRDGEYAVVSLFRNGEWQEITRATFDVLREPHYVGAYENLPQATDTDVSAVMVGLQVEDELRAREAENQITPWDLFAAAALAADAGSKDAALYADYMMIERAKRRGNE